MGAGGSLGRLQLIRMSLGTVTSMDLDQLRPHFPDIDPFGFAEVMRDVGNALWRVQQLEESVQIYLVMVYGLAGKVAADVAESVLELHKRKTLGRLVRELNASARIPADISNRLNSFVGPRNWLVHRSQGDSRKALLSTEGRAVISARLDVITEEAGAIQKLIAEHLEHELRRRGVSEATLLAEAKAELRARYGA